MSLICQNALNRSVYEFQLSEPSEILSKCREILATSLKSTDEIVADGMDISLLAFHHQTKKYTWAGANSPIWFSKDGELHKIEGSKQSVGHNHHELEFESQEIDLKPGSFVFMFSDGYCDQFGGEPNKRFNKKIFFDLLSTSLHLSISEIENLVNSLFIHWKGDREQTDDVLVMGIQIQN
jgi:serine phosphatase RsbU (regulator of sigma subunit)